MKMNSWLRLFAGLLPLLSFGYDTYKDAFEAGNKALSKSNPIEAIANFSEAEKLAATPWDRAHAILKHAAALEQDKKIDASLKKLRSLQNMDQATPVIKTVGCKTEGYFWQKQGNYGKAIECYRKGLALKSGNWAEIDTKLLLANLLIEKNIDEAIQLYSGVIENPMGSGSLASVQAYFGLGRSYQKEGNVKKAVDAYQKILSMPDSHPWFKQESEKRLKILKNEKNSANLIQNPSFEKRGKDGSIADFSQGITHSDDAVHGSYSARFDGSGAHGTYVFQRGILLRPRTCYRFSASIKCNTDSLIPKTIAFSPYSEGVMAIVFPENNNWTQRPASIILQGGKQGWTRKTKYFKTDDKNLNFWIGLYVLRTTGTAWFDHLELVECSEKEYESNFKSSQYTPSEKENMLYNGSFEITTNPDLPDGIHNGIGEAWFKKDPRPWGEQLKIGTKDTPHGKKHLQLRNHTYLIFPEKFSLETQKMTLSFLAKSLAGSGSLNVFWGKLNKTFQLTDQWKTYSITFDSPEKSTYMGFSDSGKSGISLDAVMLNLGEQAHPYGKSDREICNEYTWNVQKSPFFAPETKTVTISNKEIQIPGKNPTSLLMNRENENFKIRIHCSGSGTFDPHDFMILRFLGLPEKDNTNYSDFKVYANGKTESKHPFSAKVFPDRGGWTVDLEIPLQSAAGDRKSAEIWGFNLMRVYRDVQGYPNVINYLNGGDINELAKLRIGPNKTENKVESIELKQQEVQRPVGHVFLNKEKKMLAINGKPHIPFVLSYTLFPRFPLTVNDVKAIGFDTVYLWNIGNRLPEQGSYTLDKQKEDIRKLGEKGLYVIPQLLYGKTSKNLWSCGNFSLEEFLATHSEAQKEIRDFPHIIAWASLDEIYGHWEKGKYPKKEDDIRKVTDLLRKGDGRPVFGNVFYGKRAYGGLKNFDIVSGTFYTIRDAGGVSEFCNGTKAIMEEIRTQKAPAVGGAWIQYYNGSGEGGAREPTKEELSAMIYGGVINGLRMFQFFQDRPASNSLWFGTSKIISEIRELTDILYYGCGMPSVSNHTGVICSAYLYNGNIFLIAQNLSYSPVKGISLSVGGKTAESAEVLFENRKQAVINGTVTDSFEPHERHVYKIPVVGALK